MEAALKVLVVGANGSIAETYRNAICEGKMEMEPVAAIDPSGQCGNWDLKGRTFRSFEEFVGSGIHADAGLVLTPPQTHVEIAQELLAADMHVLIEKAPAFSVADCMMLKLTAENMERTVFFAHHAQYATGVHVMCEDLQSRNFGYAKFSITYFENVFDYRKPGTELIDLFPGCLWDSAYNALSVLEQVISPYFFEGLRYIPAESMVIKKGGVSVQAALNFGHATKPITGTLIQNWISNDSQPVRKIQIQTDLSEYLLDIHNQEFKKNGHTWMKGQPGAHTREYIGVLIDFLEHIRAGTSYVPYQIVRLLSEIEPIGFGTTEKSRREPRSKEASTTASVH